MNAFGFVGKSGCGKTTLICKLIRYFSTEGFKIGTFKHAHKGFQLDYPGKDSYRFKDSGAAAVCLISPTQSAMIIDNQLSEEMVFQKFFEFMKPLGYDFIFVEGLKQWDLLPKFCFVERLEEAGKILEGLVNCVGVITKTKETKDFWECRPVFFRDDVAALGSFIRHWDPTVPLRKK